MSKITSLITGIGGQDGHYLLKELIANGRAVVGIDIYKYSEGEDPDDHIYRYCDLSDREAVEDVIKDYQPDEIYNLGALTYVGSSWEEAPRVLDVNAGGVLNILEACRVYCPSARIYQASTSEMFGNIGVEPQDEKTPMEPVSPYGAAKLCAHHLCRIYRESFGMFVVCGIGFNHESKIRPERFVTRKVTSGVARIRKEILAGSKITPIELGNLNSKRDWSHAEDMVRAMRMMIEAPKPDDYVIASGISHSVKELCEFAFSAIGIEICWSSIDDAMVGLDSDGMVLVKSTSDNIRPVDLVSLRGDSTKLHNDLGWVPAWSFEELIHDMVLHDLQQIGVDIRDAKTKSLV